MCNVVQGAATNLHVEGGGIMYLLNSGTHLPDCMVLLCRWPLFESSLVNTSDLITAISAWVYLLKMAYNLIFIEW